MGDFVIDVHKIPKFVEKKYNIPLNWNHNGKNSKIMCAVIIVLC